MCDYVAVPEISNGFWSLLISAPIGVPAGCQGPLMRANGTIQKDLVRQNF